MKSLLVIVSMLSFMSTEVYSIVPKYIPDAEVYFRGKSLDDTRYPKQFTSTLSKEEDVLEDKSGDVINKVHSLENPKKISFDVPIEEDKTHNKLPEVNQKDATDTKSINNESVEDFIDLFEEGTDDEVIKSADRYKNKDAFFKELEPLTELEYNEGRKTPYKRAKRVISAAYDGRYKSQEINDVLKSIEQSRLKNHVKQTKNDSAKSRRKRTTNIIEEENLGTTISGFKFTGHSTYLNHDLAFKNIHS